MTAIDLQPGLSEAEAGRRREQYGPNTLESRRPPPLWSAFREVLREPMLLLLLATVAVYMALGEPREAGTLAVSVAAVIGLTLYQSVRSERALDALRSLNAPTARVLRDGRWRTVPAADVVPGDVFEAAEGERIPADGEVLEAQDLEVDEAILTGESATVAKSPGAEGDAGRVFAGTFVVRGRGRAQASETGAATRVGAIGRALEGERREAGPLQRQLRRLVLVFAGLGAALSTAIVILLTVQGAPVLTALLGGLTLAIATIPEEFPVVLSVFFALGAWRLARQRALIRRPGAIETLGAITVLCTDKTGTLTRNAMEVRRVVTADGGEWTAAGNGPTGDAAGVLRVAADACAHPTHEPMELALLEAARGESPAGLVRHYPFSKHTPMVANVYAGGTLYVACKGAPEQVLSQCVDDAATLARAREALERLSSDGLRVLGVGTAHPGAGESLPDTAAGFALNWRGLVALQDPLRPEVPAAIAEAQAAGVRVVLVTGDYPSTAAAVARAAGIDGADGVASGASLAGIEGDALAARLRDVRVLARVLPEDKLRIVRALSRHGEVVAMTGDGVNDAPALAAAHVGVAMGIRGTDVAKEAASVVLADDNFATIVRAIAMGRRIHDNLRRAIAYVFAVHIPIAGVAFLPVVLGEPMLLLPVHVLLLELLIDPASSLVFERLPASPDVMRRPPRPRDEPLLPFGIATRAAALGLASLFAVIAVYWVSSGRGDARELSATLAFVSITAGNLAILAGTGRFAATAQTRVTLLAVVLTVALFLGALIHFAPLAGAVGFVRPAAGDLALAAAFAFAVVGAVGLLIRWVPAGGRKLTGINKPAGHGGSLPAGPGGAADR